MISLGRMPNQRHGFWHSRCPSPSYFHTENDFGGTTVKAYIRGLYAARLTRVAAAAVGLLLCAVLVTLCIPGASYAQDTGYISGTVMDKSGAAVAGADVVVTNTAGSLTRSATSDADGSFTVAGLPGDTYNLIVTAKGFQKYTAQNVKLNVAEKARIDVVLTVGAVR